MEKKYIQFNNSMVLDKRNDGGAYLINNILNYGSTRGLYPQVSFQEKHIFPAGSIVKDVIDNLIFVQSSSNKINVYNKVNYQHLYEVSFPASYVSGVSGNDGVHIICSNKKVLKCTDSNYTEIGTIGSNNLSIGKALFDGLYYWYLYDSKIYRQLKSGTIEERFNDTGGNVRYADVFEDDIFFAVSNGKDTYINKWDKADATLIDKRIVLKNISLLALGNVDNSLIAVYAIGNTHNSKEMMGEIVVSAYDGLGFQKLNSIRIFTDGGDVQSFASAHGNGVLYVALYNNIVSSGFQLQDLIQNHILKIKKNGEIKTVFDTDLTRNGSVKCLAVDFDFVWVGIGEKIYSNNTYMTQGYDYIHFDEAIYITNLLDFTSKKHKFGGIGFSFEKLFTQDEEIDIYYRLSERDNWELIDNVTAEKIKNNVDLRQSQTQKNSEYNDNYTGLNIQMYEITKMPDGTPFKEYYEIQFKIILKNGFSLIDFWYYTDVQKRITRL